MSEPFTLATFVTSIVDQPSGVVVTAVNGGPDGPPLVRFRAPAEVVKSITIGTRVHLTIEVRP